MGQPRNILELVNISRRFPGVLALDSVDFDLRAGEVHALVGENGAGKSTLINIISGVLPPDSGQMLLDGDCVQLTDPVTARNAGIITVHQEAELFPTLSVAENMALGQGLPTRAFGLVDWSRVNSAAQRAVDEISEPIDVSVAAARLAVAHRHMTQIAAAVLNEAKVVILDEPTSALTEVESEWLFRQIDRLKESGAGIVYISHRQEEIFTLASRITVLRDGQCVWSGERSAIDSRGLIEAMVGRSQPSEEGRRVRSGRAEDTRLRISGLSDDRGQVRDVSLEVRVGEIVGIYGLVGAGRSEFAQTLFGLRRKASGTVQIDGGVYPIQSPQDAVRAGLAYLPEDRLRQGLCRGLSLRANTVLSSLHRWSHGPVSSAAAEKQAAEKITERLSVRHRSIQQPIEQISGGNQQKVVLGRWLLTAPRVLILDEPTRGVDVGAKAEIHRLLRGLADDGLSILMISSELPEVMSNADRVLVFRDGEVAGQFDPGQTTAREVAAAALPTDVSAPRSASEGRHEKRSGYVHRGHARKRWIGVGLMSGLRERLPVETALLVIVLAFAFWLGLTSEQFFNFDNLVQVASRASLWMILGLAAATVIIAGGIDISIGSLLALTATCAGLVLKTSLPPTISIPAAILVACFIGTAGGFLNGAISLVGRVHPIVVTLGMMIVYRGVVTALRKISGINDLPQGFTWLAVHPQSGFRGSIVFAALVTMAMYCWLQHARTGRHLYALGTSPTAARLVGISRVRTTLMAFCVGGLLTGVAGVVELAGSGQMQPQLGTGWELQAIAVAVIGGVSITGGRGSVLGVILGAMLLQLVKEALVHWRIEGDRVDVFIGGMILAAVLLDLAWRRRET